MFWYFLKGETLLLKIPPGAGSAPLSVLRNSKWRPKWPPKLSFFIKYIHFANIIVCFDSAGHIYCNALYNLCNNVTFQWKIIHFSAR